MSAATVQSLRTRPPTRGALDGLKPLEISDLARYKDAV
jgi:hypothetical protein